MYRHFFKRIVDFVAALCALPFVLLIILVMGPIIYFTDPGPIFYNGTRMGKDGVPFKMFKLRSMYVNAPDIRNADGSTYNGDDDPRVTKVGRFIRKTSLDEFPQFLNVLIGDMSIVGPRPSLATIPYEELSDVAKKRVEVRPGVTGYAQAYFRNSVSVEERFRSDCEYVDRVSFWLDIKILFKTVFSVLACKNINITSENQKDTHVKTKSGR